jgi:hypothetical protein
MLYSYKSQYPKEIPFRIKLSNGMTRTDPSTFTTEEITDAGYTKVSDKPIADATQIVEWNSETVSWNLRDKTQDEIIREQDSQWSIIRAERDRRIQEVAWRYERYARYERLNTTQIDDINILDQYVQDLADVPQTQTDPFNIVWPELNTETIIIWPELNISDSANAETTQE